MIADEQSTKTFLDFFVEQALREDVGEGDHTSQACIPADARSRARLLVKDPGVLAGVEVARHIFQKVDPGARLDVFIEDGKAVSAGDWIG